MECPWCGAENEDSARHCRICGNKLKVSKADEEYEAAEKKKARAKSKDRSRRLKEDRITVILGMILAAAVVVGGIGAFYGISRVMNSQSESSSAGELSDEMVQELNRTQQTTEAAPTETPAAATPEAQSTPAATAADPTIPVGTSATEITAAVAYSYEVSMDGCVEVPILYGDATSVIEQDNFSNDASMTYDGDETTSWQEGVSGNGEGETIYLGFGALANVKYVNVKLGNWRSEEYFYLNSRPQIMTLTVGDKSFQVAFPDGKDEFTIGLSDAVSAGSISLTIDSVYEGEEYEDTCISEISVYAIP